jgi:hypothetical protein
MREAAAASSGGCAKSYTSVSLEPMKSASDRGPFGVSVSKNIASVITAPVVMSCPLKASNVGAMAACCRSKASR